MTWEPLYFSCQRENLLGTQREIMYVYVRTVLEAAPEGECTDELFSFCMQTPVAARGVAAPVEATTAGSGRFTPGSQGAPRPRHDGCRLQENARTTRWHRSRADQEKHSLPEATTEGQRWHAIKRSTLVSFRCGPVCLTSFVFWNLDRGKKMCQQAVTQTFVFSSSQKRLIFWSVASASSCFLIWRN